MQEALLLIDIQNDYFPGGKMELVGMKKPQKKPQNSLKHSVLRANPFSLSDICLQDQMLHSLYPVHQGTEIN
jgi:hypothetical protein